MPIRYFFKGLFNNAHVSFVCFRFTRRWATSAHTQARARTTILGLLVYPPRPTFMTSHAPLSNSFGVCCRFPFGCGCSRRPLGRFVRRVLDRHQDGSWFARGRDPRESDTTFAARRHLGFFVLQSKRRPFSGRSCAVRVPSLRPDHNRHQHKSDACGQIPHDQLRQFC